MEDELFVQPAKKRHQVVTCETVEKMESHLYMTIRILYELQFYGHQGNDLFDTDKVTYQEVLVKKQDSLRDVINILSEQSGQSTDR